MKAIAAVLFTFLFLASVFAALPSGAHASTITNDRIGDLTVFDQNYSVEGITDNIFAADPSVHTYVANYTLSYSNEKKAVEFHTWPGNTYNLHIGQLYPAVHTKIKMTLDYTYGNWNDKVDIHTATTYVMVQKTDGGMYRLYVFYYNDTGGLQNILKNNIQYTGAIPLDIEWNGENKTVHITVENNNTISIWAPALNKAIRDYPLPVLSGTYIQITTEISSLDNGDGVHLYLYSIQQTIPRYTITAVPRNNLQPLGFDGPHSWNTVKNGLAYVDKYGYRATIFFDVTEEWATNSTVKQYLADYVNNKSWEVGIHFSKELTSLSLAAAEQNMTKEYNEVKENFSAPISFCSLTDADNVTHAQYAYSNWKMIWRNEYGNGIEGISNIGNLDNQSWPFWDVASQHGFVYPAFTHETDLEPAADFSIDYSKFTTWVDRAHNHSIEIVPFAEYYYINANQHDAYFTNIEKGERYIKFTAHTNGYKAYVDVNYTPDNNTVVKDLTTGEYINWTNGSVQFWVEDGHEYEITEEQNTTGGAGTTSTGFDWQGWFSANFVWIGLVALIIIAIAAVVSKR